MATTRFDLQHASAKFYPVFRSRDTVGAAGLDRAASRDRTGRPERVMPRRLHANMPRLAPPRYTTKRHLLS